MSDFFYLLENCELCPRKCGANRLKGERGYCNSGAGFEISSICIHNGEEPPISGKLGICNIFFPHCNIQCVFCQNCQISDNKTFIKSPLTLNNVVDQIISILNRGINILGFVSPTHYLPQVIAITEAVRKRGYEPVTLWNSNAYELPEILGLLDESIDVFMPDFKYSDNDLAERFSDATDYPGVAEKAIQKMIQMRGARLICDENGLAYRGMIIRHLVLPGHPGNSLSALRTIAENLSANIPVSLMSQYHPEHQAQKFPEIYRRVSGSEYKAVTDEYMLLELSGWFQEPESAEFYLPDFNKNHPFEKE